MKDHQKTKEQLVREVAELRRQIQATGASVAEHKQTDGRLRSVHRKLRAVFDAIQDGICAVDLDFNLTDVNAGMLKAFDLPDKESVLGRKCFEVFRGREENCPHCVVAEAYRTKGPACRTSMPEDPASTDDGAYEVFAYPILDEQGDPIGAVEFARDVSARKRAENALSESEARFRTLVENVPDVMLIVDRNHSIRYANHMAPDATVDELIGTTGFQHVLAEYHEIVVQVHQRAFETGEVQALEVIDDQGRTWSCRVVPIGEGTVVEHLMVICTDTTEQKRAEEALRESETRFRSLIENLPDFVLVVDRGATIQFSNRPSPKAPQQKLAGTTGFSHIVPEDEQTCREALQRAFATGEVQTVEARTKYGGWWDCRLVPIADGSEPKAMIICADVSQRKEVENAVQQKQQQLGRLLDMHERDRRLVAYEIHDGFVQPLTAAKMVFEGHLRVLQDTYPDAVWHDCGKALQLLDRSIDEARQLINGQRPMILDEMGLLPAVSHLINDQRGDGSPIIEYSHQVEFDRLASPLETAVFRIIQESLANVLRHSNSPKVRIGMVQRGDRIRVEIEDWGIGFDPQKVETNRFGLEGLRQRARLLGGQATIDSAPGKGTRVTVELPLVQGVP